RSIHKSLAQLEAELQVLESLWGGQICDAVIAATVSHQHLYGLLFTILWPLLAGRPYCRRAFVDPLSLAAHTARIPRSAWIMSPAHLHRLGDAMPWPQLRGRVAAVFCSGGPLQQAAAGQLHDGLGLWPLEVLGSS